VKKKYLFSLFFLTFFSVGPALGQSTSQAPTLTSYQNYDFIPGNNILFEDEFTDDPIGELPAHWELKRGQAAVNLSGADKAFFLTDAAIVQPRLKGETYLTKNFSIEYDVFSNGPYPPEVQILDVNKSGDMVVTLSGHDVSWKGYVTAGDHSTNFAADLPSDISDRGFFNKWHHFGIIYKNDQIKVYVDKYRVLLVPHCNGLQPAYVVLNAGRSSLESPVLIKNFKIADGAQMYMTGQTFTDAKIVTHGINFDVNKAVIKPESMGTLNMIVRVLNENPGLRFEIDGHTDNTGVKANNLTLSQQRADAVKVQLVTMGIDGSRLTTKGFGDTMPISDNSTLEGKANNRRVEFVKQ
jgi:OmpA-OmpF porin, OOP family